MSPTDSLAEDFAMLRHHDTQARFNAFSRAFRVQPALATKAFLEHDFIDTLESLHVLIGLVDSSMQKETQLRLNLELSIAKQQ